MTNTKDDDHQHDDGSSSDDDDDATIEPRKLVREHGTERLKAALLDRLAEFMAAIPPGGRGPGEDKTAKAKDICATFLQMVDGTAVVYITKNGGLSPDDVKMLKRLQIGLSAGSRTWQPRDKTKDLLRPTMVQFYKGRLVWYLHKLGEVFRQVQSTFLVDDNEINSKLARLQQLCFLNEELDDGQWTDAISLEYELRHEPPLKAHLHTLGLFEEDSQKLLRQVLFLGRPESA
ncbi:hypothetical protein VE01_04074 [Pseudogymnoascus verrucosus]|uniref:Uncharacterized protein n=1 Tax=Pseudogymnoascus verrucosus TaxID=342668 RepID=A0A1B8GLK2_9PEZI|nr:uncharacterized protein VE01_04074 [Pseudogymnoascus verrucosus]OBT96720.1 hypothetical protein VE01_04074 [Pseudogymnoascus verrucosus]